MAKEPVERIIIGKPMQPNGQPSENLARVQQSVARWKKEQPEVPIEYVDERFTSVLAHRAMIDGGLHKKARQDKALVDEISATIILQSYMEGKRGVRSSFSASLCKSAPAGRARSSFSRLKPFLRLASLI